MKHKLEVVLTFWLDEPDGSDLSCSPVGFVSSGFIDLLVGWPSAMTSGLALRFVGAPRSRGWSSSCSGILSTLGWWAWAGGGSDAPLGGPLDEEAGGGGGSAAEVV